MTNMEKFNHMINQSNHDDKSTTEAFRIQVDMILKTTFHSLLSHKKVIIIGAGKMNDFSLNFFVRNFEEVVLTDIDTLTVKEAFLNARISQKDRNKVRIERVEYTGFEEMEFFQGFKERLITCRSFEKIEHVLKMMLKGRTKKQFLIDEEQADLVYVSPIYTQLVYNQLLRECSILRDNGYPEHLIKYIESIMLDEMVDIIDEFNDQLLQLVKPGGTLFVLSDIFQVDIGSHFHLRIKNGITNHDVMEEIYSGYKEKYGLGLGDYGLYNLDTKMNNQLSRWFIWPFDEKSCFVVKLKIYQNKVQKEEQK